MLLLLVISIGVVAKLISAPVEGRATKADLKLQHAPPQAAKQQLPASNLNSTYFELALPQGYKVQPASQAIAGLLYQQTIIKPGAFGSLVINIAIKPLPDGGVAGDSSYQTRQQQPSRYKFTNQSNLEDSIAIANDNQAAAVVAFWPHANYLATISVSSAVDNLAMDGNKDLLAALAPVLSAWHWRG